MFALIARRVDSGMSQSDKECNNITDTLDIDNILQSIYRELLFLGEWIDATDGSCPLFSYTFFSITLCLKACKVLLLTHSRSTVILKVCNKPVFKFIIIVFMLS